MWWKNKNHNDEFVFNDMWGTVWGTWPIVAANRFTAPYEGYQKTKYVKPQLQDCPGMHDYKNQGWLMLAWCEIEVHHDGKNTMMYYGHRDKGAWPTAVNQECPYKMEHNKHIDEQWIKDASGMSTKIADGIAEHRDQNPTPMHISSPWAIVNKGCSLMVQPPVYHSNISEDFFFYPGIVDYENGFSTMNFIFSCKKEGKFTIKPGTPLLHMIPMIKKDWKAYYTHDKTGGIEFYTGALSNAKQFYRKMVQKRNRFTIDRWDK